MTAHEPNDDTANKSTGTTRRRFLGAAAALGLLGTATGTTHATPDVTHGDTGSTMAEYPSHAGVSSTLDLWLPHDDDASVRVVSYDYDDEHGDIELAVGTTGASLTLNLTPADAREIAADLEAAARRITNEGH